MVTESEKEKLWIKYNQYCYNNKIDPMVYDIEAKIDNTLDFWENWNLIEEDIKLLKESYTKKEMQQLADVKLQKSKFPQYHESIKWDQICRTAKSIVVLGETRSGKTAWVYFIIKSFQKPVFILRHPKPELIEELGYKQMYSLSEIEYIQDCVLWIDEPQLHINTYDKKANCALQKLLSLCGQRGITLILSTSDTRFVTRGLESYMDIWIIKDIEVALVKQGSLIKKIIQDHCFIETDGFSLKVNEYLFHSRNFKEFIGKHEFEKPLYFDDRYSKPYRLEIANKTATKSPNETAKIKIGDYNEQ